MQPFATPGRPSPDVASPRDSLPWCGVHSHRDLAVPDSPEMRLLLGYLLNLSNVYPMTTGRCCAQGQCQCHVYDFIDLAVKILLFLGCLKNLN